MASKDQNEPRADETTGSPEGTGQSPHSTPGQAEGDRETVEESLRQKEHSEQNTEAKNR